MMAFLSNYVEIRADGMKLVRIHQRPLPVGAEDIGTWQLIFTAIAGVSVVTNAALVFFTMTLFEDSSPENRLWYFILFQYFVFSSLYLFAVLVPDVPEDVQIQLERTEFLVDKIIDKVADEDDAELLAQMAGSTVDIHIETA